MHALMQISIALFYICLLYKQSAPGMAVLFVLCLISWLYAFRAYYVWSVLGIFSALYVFMALGTAFLVSIEEGAYRTIQFLLIVVATVGISNYLFVIGGAERQKLLWRFLAVNIVIFAHMVIHHVSMGHLLTWKYLHDTKTTLSIVPLLLFICEDRVRARMGTLVWFLLLGGLGVLVVLSGERKAYVLFAILFALSRSPVVQKAILGTVAGVAIMVYLAGADPENYIMRQMASLLTSERKMEIAEFYEVESIGNQSNIIRDFANRMAWEQFLQHPVLGLGATGYQRWAQGTLGMPDDTGGLSMNVHGELNRVPVEGGLIGIAIACVLLFALTRAVLGHVVSRGGIRSSSLDRAPLYVLCFLLLYCSYEASDSLMLIMIMMFGLDMARLSREDHARMRPAVRPAPARLWRRHGLRPRGGACRPRSPAP
jgi:hypothetical protein